MISHRRNRFRALSTAFVISLLLSTTSAAAQGSTEADHDSHAAVVSLLERFEATYQPSADQLDAAWQVAALGRQLELDSLPRLSFTERVMWHDFQRFSVDLDLSALLTLYRGNAEPLAILQEHRVQLLELERVLAQHDDRIRFHNDLLALASFRFVEQQLADALARTTHAPWRNPGDLQEALSLYPEERDPVALQRSIEDLHRQVAIRVIELEGALQTTLRTTEVIPALPPLEEVMPLLTPADADLEKCLKESPLLAQATLHHTVQGLERQVQDAPDLRVELHGGASYRSGDLLATIGLEMRLPLPSTAPLAGQVSAAVTPSSAEQALRLSWPPSAPMTRPINDLERVQQLADERAGLEAEIVSLFRALTSDRNAVHSVEMQLLWLVTDAHETRLREDSGSGRYDVEQVRALSLVPLREPVAELQRVRYLSELTFAQLALAERELALGLVCGSGT